MRPTDGASPASPWFGCWRATGEVALPQASSIAQPPPAQSAADGTAEALDWHASGTGIGQRNKQHWQRRRTLHSDCNAPERGAAGG